MISNWLETTEFYVYVNTNVIFPKTREIIFIERTSKIFFQKKIFLAFRIILPKILCYLFQGFYINFSRYSAL